MFVFKGLMAGWVEKVAYTALPSTENALPPVSAGETVPVRPMIVRVWVSNRNGPAMKREPSVDADRMARSPVTFLLRKTVPEATS